MAFAAGTPKGNKLLKFLLTGVFIVAILVEEEKGYLAFVSQYELETQEY